MVSSVEPLISFTPDVPFPDLRQVAVTLKGDRFGFEGQVIEAGIQNLAGLGLVGDFVFSYTTGDTSAPAIVNLSPPDGADEIPLGSVVRFEFSEPVARFSVAGFTLAQGGNPVAGSMNTLPILGDRVFVFTPEVPLLPNRGYRATLQGPLADLAGNVMAAAQVSSNFQTIDTLAPVIDALTVVPGASQIAGAIVPVTAAVNDVDDLAFVEFYVDGRIVLSDAEAPFVAPVLLDPVFGAGVNVAAVAVDESDNRSAVSNLFIAINDNQAPTVTIVSPGAGSVVGIGRVVVLNIDASDDVGLTEISFTANDGVVASGVKAIDTQASVNTSFAFTVPDTLAAGSEIRLRAAAKDALDLTVQSVEVVLSVEDRQPPTVIIGSPANNSVFNPGDAVSVFVRADDISGVSALQLLSTGAVLFDETRAVEPAATPAAETFTFTIPPDALPTETVQLTARATDSAGNIGERAITLRIIDRLAPQVQLATVSGSTEIDPGQPAVLRVSATDEVGVTRIELTVTGIGTQSRDIAATVSAVEEFTFAVPVTATPGDIFAAQATVFDAAGNSTQSAPLTLTAADRTPPDVTVIAPAAGSEVRPGESFEVRVQASDAFGVSQVTFSASGAVTASEQAVIDPPAGVVEQVFNVAVPMGAASSAAIMIDATATDTAGNTGNAAAVTVSVADVVGPQVLQVVPADGEVDIDLTASVVLRFSEPIDPATVTAASLTLVNGAVEPLDFSFSAGDTIVTLAPADGALEPGTAYTVSVQTNVSDVAGNGLAAAFTSGFTTVAPDATPPRVLAINPADGATGVSIGTVVDVSFTEPLDPATVTGASVQLSAGGNPVTGALSLLAGDTLVRFTPAEVLPLDTLVTTALTDAITDVEGNALADANGDPLAAPLSFDFTTGVFAITSPVDASTVAENTQILLEARASTALGVSTVVFTVNGTALAPVAGPPFTALFTVPSAAAVQLLTIDAEARNAAGVVLAQAQVVANVGVGMTLAPRVLGVPLGASADLLLSVSTPLGEDLAVTMSAVDASVIEVPANVLLPAGELQLAIPVTGLSVPVDADGASTTVFADAAPGRAAAIVTVSEAVSGREIRVVAPPVGTRVPVPPSAGEIYMDANSAQPVSIPLLDAPAGTDTLVMLVSSDATIADVPVAVVIPAGAIDVNFTVLGGNAGTALLTLRAGNVVRSLTVIVDTPSAGTRVPAAAGPVGVHVLTPPSAGEIYMDAAGAQPVSIPFLDTPAGTEILVTLVSSDATIADVPATAVIPVGATDVNFTVLGGNAGTALLTLRAGNVVRSLTVIVDTPSAGARVPAVARPVGVDALALPSVGQVAVPVTDLKALSIELLANPATTAVTVTFSTADGAIADTLEAQATIPIGGQSVDFSVISGLAGETTLTLNFDGESRELTVQVGTSAPAVIAPPVGVEVQP
jgi:hypothetical protein